ncbi:MAG: peptidylprolyl isomerase [Gammaproteobacteria bacterium]|nr:peptidylprolyl isomerase [Gammaproteobacteria bacterium]
MITQRLAIGFLFAVFAFAGTADETGSTAEKPMEGKSEATQAASDDTEMKESEQDNPKVLLDTSHGTIMLELFADKAPLTVKHFLKLVDDGHYDGIIFHRAHKGFVIQAGSWDQDLNSRDVPETVKNEAMNGLKNSKGTVAMARYDDPDSASADFFINTKNNHMLNYSESEGKAGYAVFGKVIRGMKIVHEIENLNTKTEVVNGVELVNFPVDTVVITKAQQFRDR